MILTTTYLTLRYKLHPTSPYLTLPHLTSPNLITSNFTPHHLSSFISPHQTLLCLSNPPDCRHPSRASHACHFDACPLCRLTCNQPLNTCQHKCQAKCHDSRPTKVESSRLVYLR